MVMWLRDTVPPGQGSVNQAETNGYGYVRSWYTDSKNQGPYSNNGCDAAGTYTFTTPPLRPGVTYFAGFRSNNSATFSVSSTISGGSIGVLPSLDFYTGTVTTSIPANSSVVYRVSVPPEATRWQCSGTHASAVQVRIEQGTLPGTTGAQHWYSSGANSSFNVALSASSWPWQPDQTYYVRFVNNDAAAQSITFTMNGKNALTEDNDNDGLPDAWEIQYFGNTSSYNGASDPDCDGVSNLQEYLDGTNPTDANSAMYSLTVSATHGAVTRVPAQTKYLKGSQVTLSVTPERGYSFLL